MHSFPPQSIGVLPVMPLIPIDPEPPQPTRSEQLPSSLVATVVSVLGLPRGSSTPTSQTGIHHLNQQRVSRREQRDRQTRPANGGIPGRSCRIRKILLHLNIHFCMQAHNHNPAPKEPLTVGTSSRQLVQHQVAKSTGRYWRDRTGVIDFCQIFLHMET